MIDIVINGSALTVAHDEERLDAFDAIEVDMSTGQTVLTGGESRFRLADLLPSLRAMVQPRMTVRAVRMDGWRIARIAPLTLRTRG